MKIIWYIIIISNNLINKSFSNHSANAVKRACDAIMSEVRHCKMLGLVDTIDDYDVFTIR